MARAAIYARISDDRGGRGLGVARQRADCEALAERHGHDVVEVFVDNDLSAYSGKPRPQYRRMLQAVEDGHVQVIVAWHPDRLHRSPRELEDFIDLLDRTGCTVETVTAGRYDLSTPNGKMTARMLGAVARYESEHKSARIRRKAEELAAAGKVGGGGWRPFGYLADRVTPHPVEATLVRDAAERIVAGASLRSIVVDWDDRGIRTTTGKRWTTPVLRRLLRSPRIAGLREHRGEVVAEAVWPAIVDRALWERVCAVLNDPERSKAGPPRRYLLTGGIGVCGVCGGRLFARPKADGRRCYACVSGPGFGGCGKTRCLADPLEADVAERLFAALDDGRLLALLEAADDDAPLVAQLREDEAALEQLEVAHFTEGVLSRAGYLAARQKIQNRIDATRRKLTARVPAVPDGALAEHWRTADMEWRRRWLQVFVERVELGPAVRGRNFYDGDRVTIYWRA